jgi:Na+-translocating ferredoxin:NAD+ oxidoreductase RnfD subunit
MDYVIIQKFKNVIEIIVLSHAVKLITGTMMLMMTFRHVEEIVTLITTKIGCIVVGLLVAMTIIFVNVLMIGSIILVVNTTQKE